MSPITSLLATDRQPIPPKLLPNVLAGLTVGLVSLTYSVSFAALIFTGSLSPGFPQGVGSALITSAIVGAIVSFNLLWQAIGVFVPPNPHGWFLEAVASDKLWHSWTAASFTQVDWQVLLGQLGASIVLVVVVVITLLLNITGVKLLHEWVIRAWFRFSHLDYALILLILTIIAIWDFLVERLMYAHTDIEELL